MESRKSLTLYMQRVVVFVYAKSHQLFCNLTEMHRKPSACFKMRQKPLACFGLCMGMVPKAYQRSPVNSPMLDFSSMVTLISKDSDRKDSQVPQCSSTCKAKAGQFESPSIASTSLVELTGGVTSQLPS
jgi:hypothetical protein